MWLLFGFAAIITGILNVVQTFRNHEAKWLRFTSLSCTAFTLCSFLSQTNEWVLLKDWSALMDVLPGVSKVMWLLTTASVAINSFSLFKKK